MFIVSRNEEVAVRPREEDVDVPAMMAIAQCQDLEVLAMRSFCDREGVVLLLVTNNSSKTTRLLEHIGYDCWTNPVLLVGPLSRRGWTVPLEAELESSGIHVRQSYAHRTERGQHYVALKTEEDDRALRVLELSDTLHQAVDGSDDRFANAADQLQPIAA